MIPAHTVRQILESAKIEDVVADYVDLRRRGANLIGRCPFHDEKTPSFSVSPSKGIYKCFGCGKAGNAAGFLMEHESFSFPEALRHLAKQLGIEIEEREMTAEEKQLEEGRNSLLALMEYATEFFQRHMMKNDYGRAVAYSYFKERGLLDKTMEDFKLGFVPAQGGLVGELKTMGFQEELLKRAGLLNKNGGDFFRNRVMFPISNLSGKTIAFAGRILNKDAGPKYINSPETEIYIKNKILYGMDLAKSDIRKHDECFLVEGYMDVIMLHQNGVKNVVASSGTALTSNQAHLIKRFTQNITMLYDGDAAGVKAAVRGVEIMLPVDLNVRIAMLPPEHDPDSFIKEYGREGFDDFLAKNKTDFILFFAKVRLDEINNDPIRKTEFILEVVRLLALISNTIKRSAYVQELASLTDIGEEVIVDELNKVIKKNQWSERKTATRQETSSEPEADSEIFTPPSNIAPKLYYKEKDLLRVMVKGGNQKLPEEELNIFMYIFSQVHEDFHFETELFEKTLDLLKKTFEEHGQLSSKLLMSTEDKEVNGLIAELTHDPYTFSENWAKKDIYLQTQKMPDQNYLLDSQQAILRLKLERLNIIANENYQELLDLEDDDEIKESLEVQQEINKMRTQLAKELGTAILD